MVQRFLLAAGVMLSLAGCATTQPHSSAADLQLRVGELEKQVEAKDTEIKDLKYTIKDMSYELDRTKAQRFGAGASGKSDHAKNDEILRVNVSPEKLQQALKAAGYYNGAIDGKLGNRTKVAVSKFQKDHGLKADGVVGERTWRELKAARATERAAPEHTAENTTEQ